MTPLTDLARYFEASRLMRGDGHDFGNGICIMRDLADHACGPIRERARKRLEIRVPECWRNDWSPGEPA